MLQQEREQWRGKGREKRKRREERKGGDRNGREKGGYPPSQDFLAPKKLSFFPMDFSKHFLSLDFLLQRKIILCCKYTAKDIHIQEIYFCKRKYVDKNKSQERENSKKKVCVMENNSPLLCKQLHAKNIRITFWYTWQNIRNNAGLRIRC